MNKELATIIVAIISSGAFTALINGIMNNHKKNDAERQGIMFLLASSIRNECQQYINDGEISGADLERLEKAWKIYHDRLEGNGFLDNYMNQIRRLPLKVLYR